MADILENLLQRAEQRKDDKLQVKKIKCEAVGGSILIRKPPVSVVTELIDQASEAETTMEALRANAALVYEAVPEIKNNYGQLSEAFDVSDPYDLVIRIFENSIGEINKIADEIMQMYGFDTSSLKN